MSAHATFKVTNWNEHHMLETEGGSKVTRATVTMAIEGDVAGEGTVEWLMGYDGDGHASFVGMERVVGKVGERSGTFVLQHTGIFDGANAKAHLRVVPGSGTGDLAGITGEGRLEAGLGSDGVRHIDLDYEL